MRAELVRLSSVVKESKSEGGTEGQKRRFM